MQELPDLSQMSHAQKDELIGVLWQMVMDLQARLKVLEGRLSLTSHNSSKPPSSDGLGKKPAPQSLRQAGRLPTGGQKGHSGNTLRQSAQVDHVIEHFSPSASSACPICSSTRAQYSVLDTRQVFDLPALRAQVTEHRLMRRACACGAVHDGAFPAGINAPAQYGRKVKAMAVHLNQYHLVPLERTGQLMRDIFGVRLSQASVQSFSQQAAGVLSATVAAIGQAVQRAPVVHADESGIRIKGKTAWLHCLVTPTLSWLAPHSRRGQVAFDGLGQLAGVRGTLVHDGLASYKDLDCTHSLCNAHHLRELAFIHEQCGEKLWDGWASEMMALLVQAKQEVQRAGGPLQLGRQAWFAGQWDQLLARGERLNRLAVHTGAPTGKRGRLAQSKAFNLLRRLRLYRGDVWRFMTDRDVPFTNNLAEQALRMCKVKQKISGCFRTTQGADTFFTIRSYLATMHKQGACLFDCLASVFNGQPQQPCLAG